MHWYQGEGLCRMHWFCVGCTDAPVVEDPRRVGIRFLCLGETRTRPEDPGRWGESRSLRRRRVMLSSKLRLQKHTLRNNMRLDLEFIKVKPLVQWELIQQVLYILCSPMYDNDNYWNELWLWDSAVWDSMLVRQHDMWSSFSECLSIRRLATRMLGSIFPPWTADFFGYLKFFSIRCARGV